MYYFLFKFNRVFWLHNILLVLMAYNMYLLYQNITNNQLAIQTLQKDILFQKAQ